MSWVTVVFSMTASASLTLAFIYGFIWWRHRDAWVNLLFSLVALGTAAFAWANLALLRAESPAQYSAAIYWGQVAAWAIVLPLAGFVRLYFRAGRPWLLWGVCVARTVSLLLNFLTGQNLNYREITALGHTSFLGEALPIAVGAPNPWMLIGNLSIVALVIFILDASITVWRRGEQRLALMLGGSILLFATAALAQSMLVFWGVIQWPPVPSLFYLGVIVAMGYELASDAARSANRARDLRAREQELTLAAEAVKLGFWSWEFARNEIWATEQWRTLFGFTTSERLDLNFFLQRLHPDDREMTRQTLLQRAPSNDRYQMQYRVLLPDGRMRWIASHGRIEFSDGSVPLRLRGIAVDITHAKQMDLEVEAQRNDLAHLLRLKSLGELSSGIAHELKQPLTTILSNAQAVELLARHPCDLQQIREIAQDIILANRRASDIINGLRALAKKSEFEPLALLANELIHDVLRFMNNDLMARDVRIATELTEHLPAIRGDRVQLQQVLINLILNASDAMSQPADLPHVLTLRSGRAESHVQISVADTGNGIPPGLQERIFEPYHTTKPQGMGLGLSLSRSIVSAHGGRLWAENQIGGGAVFHFTIPEWNDKVDLKWP
jgi:two-component system, LuxR family, sensor kinase FixL